MWAFVSKKRIYNEEVVNDSEMRLATHQTPARSNNESFKFRKHKRIYNEEVVNDSEMRLATHQTPARSNNESFSVSASE
ncbi:hypothetical protein L2E82_51270 [Cichorium intybus]|nr:hypothetical protein L2E82_51270 [Cichorium intybus]